MIRSEPDANLICGQSHLVVKFRLSARSRQRLVRMRRLGYFITPLKLMQMRTQLEVLTLRSAARPHPATRSSLWVVSDRVFWRLEEPAAEWMSMMQRYNDVLAESSVSMGWSSLAAAELVRGLSDFGPAMRRRATLALRRRLRYWCPSPDNGSELTNVKDDADVQRCAGLEGVDTETKR